MHERALALEREARLAVDADEPRKGLFSVFYDEFELEEYRSADGGVSGVMRVLYDVPFFPDARAESAHDGLTLRDHSL